MWSFCLSKFLQKYLNIEVKWTCCSVVFHRSWSWQRLDRTEWPHRGGGLSVDGQQRSGQWFLETSRSTEAHFSHRKHCSPNASSVAPPLIPWHRDITLPQQVTYFHSSAASLTLKNWFNGSVVVRGAGSGVCVLTNQSRLGINEGGALKRQELKQNVSDHIW